MGEPKALLPWGPEGRPLVQHQCAVLGALVDVVVVVGADAGRIMAAAPLAPPARYLVHPGWQAGRSSSVAAGARALPGGLEAVLIAAVDQPLEAALVLALLEAFEPGAHDLAEPVRGGRPGHPLLLTGERLADLRRAPDFDEGLRGVVRAARVRSVQVPWGAPDRDLNTPEAYRAARGHLAEMADGEDVKDSSRAGFWPGRGEDPG